MAEATKIEWCDSTFNPWIGCTKVSPACDDCYAARSTPARAMGITWGPGEQRHRTSVHAWREPLRWEKYHHTFEQAHGRRRRVFCASLADVFDNEVPPAWRAELFALIASTPHLDWLLLTKRIGNVSKMLAETSEYLARVHKPLTLPLPNVWLGATIVNQEEADRDIHKLLAVPARVRFLSMEPLLGPVDLTRVVVDRFDMGRKLNVLDVLGNTSREEWVGSLAGTGRLHHEDGAGRVDWVIVGGESGSGARPMSPEWVRSLRDQCAAAGVPFLFKQHGEWISTDFASDEQCDMQHRGIAYVAPDGSWTDGVHGVQFFGGDRQAVKLGKKHTGRLLDGVEHNGFPAA